MSGHAVILCGSLEDDLDIVLEAKENLQAAEHARRAWPTMQTAAKCRTARAVYLEARVAFIARWKVRT